jgi:hypothetical protein
MYVPSINVNFELFHELFNLIRYVNDNSGQNMQRRSPNELEKVSVTHAI